MNSCSTWTSRGYKDGGRRQSSKVSNDLKNSSSPPNTLRLAQKTCGLFDTLHAGTKMVAGKALKPGLLLDRMDSLTELVPSDALGELFQEMPAVLTESDYLDSFMDLSNFFSMDGSLKPETDVVCADDGVVKGKLDFSGLVNHLDDKPSVTMTTTTETQSVTPATSRKRKHVDYLNVANFDAVAILDVKEEINVSDHDYVSKAKKPKQALEVVVPTPSTSTGSSAPGKKTPSKYRERRDKNNVASRRSREIRKMKFVDMNKEADELEIRNEVLRKKIEEFEELAKIMKAELIKKMTK